MPGLAEIRLARAAAGDMTFTPIATAQTSNPVAGVDRAGTAHVLYSAPLIPATAGFKLQHAKVSSAGVVTAPAVLWTGGAARVLTSPDGDVYGYELLRTLLVHLGP
jgi:hypothetical protein